MCRFMWTSSRLGLTLLTLILFTPSQALPGGSAIISKAAVFFIQRHFKWNSNVLRNPGWGDITWKETITMSGDKIDSSPYRPHFFLWPQHTSLCTHQSGGKEVVRGVFPLHDSLYPCPEWSRCCCSGRQKESRWGWWDCLSSVMDD